MVNGNISADDFSIIFIRMFEKTAEKVRWLEIDLKEIFWNFKVIIKRESVWNFSSVYGDCDRFNPDLSSEDDFYLDEGHLLKKSFSKCKKSISMNKK